jgi:hypothetical protein
MIAENLAPVSDKYQDRIGWHISLSTVCQRKPESITTGIRINRASSGIRVASMGSLTIEKRT